MSCSKKIISNYLQWNKVIDKIRITNYAEIQQKVLTYDEPFKSISIELYYSYVLNTLPYRSYENILDILKHDNLPIQFKQKLECIVIYCQLNGFNNDDSTPLSLFLVEDQESKENILITLQDLEYLNNQNLAGFSLDQFKINLITRSQYMLLLNKLYANLDIPNSKIIRFDKESSKLFNDLEQLKSNNSAALNQEIIKIIDKFIKYKNIPKSDLIKLINSDIVKRHLKDVESQELSVNHLHNINFPGYLRNLIRDKFTAANIVAKHINTVINKIVSQYKLKINIEQTNKLKEICFQVVQNPNKKITIPPEIKIELFKAFKDYSIMRPFVNTTNSLFKETN